MIKNKTKPFVLVILDGWGLAPASRGNAITLAKTPVMDKLYKIYPHTALTAHGRKAGLPDDREGNSEAGHMNLGAGRIVEQDSMVISESITMGRFYKNAAFLDCLKHVNKNNSALHLMGMLSNGQSAHSDPDHLLALLALARKQSIKRVFLYLFTDGRDSPKHASLKLIEALMRQLQPREIIAAVMGRFYAMDRKKDWERTEKAYHAIVLGEGRAAKSPQAAITESYNREESDEFIPPYVMQDKGKPRAVINDGDGLIFFNLRSDRARQITKPFVQKDFNSKNPGSFKRRKVVKNLFFVAMTDFGPDLDSITSAFPSADLQNTLPMVLQERRQLYIAEREKYAHVTYFFNGGYADPVNGEDRVVIPSPDVRSYDEKPEMAAYELTEKLEGYLSRSEYDFITVNYANPDMVGHTGNLKAGVKAVEAVDECLGKLIKTVLDKNGQAIITADHGNIEKMINPETGEIDTEHSTNPVPFILAGNEFKNKKIKLPKGVLGDVAPTILELLGKGKVKEMRSGLLSE